MRAFIAAIAAALCFANPAAAQDAEADKAGMELGARDGEEVQARVSKLYALPTNVVERTKKAMIYKRRSERQKQRARMSMAEENAI
jgi:hypothetical protein